MQDIPARSDWTREDIARIFDLPFSDLIFRAQTIHRHRFDPNQVQLSTLLSIKTGGCPEDCGYCSQSVHNETGLKASKLMDYDSVMQQASLAKATGATRYCMGAAWRNPKDHELDQVCRMVEGVNALGMETCVTLGMLTAEQSRRLKQSGLDYYNHNIDSSEEFYGNVITTRTYADRLETLQHVRESGINVCCGGIVGMGESRDDRVGMLLTLPVHPESVPINLLTQIAGTRTFGAEKLDTLELVRTIATARITMPGSMVRLSAGREELSDEAQALCFVAGANSIFLGSKLLTAGNPDESDDFVLLDKLKITAMPLAGSSAACAA
jgi:biotin synthase